MEESLISTNYYRSKPRPSCSSRDDYSCDEESGWTVYLEDFMSNNNKNNKNTKDHRTFSSFCGWESSSMVSPTACSGNRKQGCSFDDDNNVVESSLSKDRHGRIGSKKRKTNTDVIDHELEDTASSPSHSPKAHDLNQLYMNMKSQDRDVRQFCQENGSGFDQTGQGTQVGFLGKDSNCAQLRNKGICLVPLSMLLNYVS